MIGRRNAPPRQPESDAEPRGFDDFDLRLGDIMRGERATLGKSLLDVQRELKIKASYISAIENSDPSAFETPGFIAGYVRSYARYLGLDPEWAFSKFCEEGGFTVVHGMSAAASGPKAAKVASSKSAGLGRDPFEQPNTPFVPNAESLLSRIEPGALGSSVVLLALIGFIGYGGWSVLQEMQRVQFVPVEQTPGVTAQVDPLAPGSDLVAGTTEPTSLSTPDADALDRLYRPQPLDVPVYAQRDAPISTLDPNANATIVDGGSVTPTIASVAPSADPIASALAEALGVETPSLPTVQVTEQDIPQVVMFAARPSWVRVTSVDGTVLFEKVLDTAEGWVLPKTEVPPLMRSGNAGSVYFAVEGQVYGPAGEGPSIVKEVALSADDLRSVYGVTDEVQDINVREIIRRAMERRESAE